MTAQAAPRSGPGLRGVLGRALPYLLLAPGMIWLAVFYVLPAIQMFTYSISTGSVEEGYTIDLSGAAYITALTEFSKQFINSIVYGGIATILTLVIGFPVAYTIAFRGGRYKNLILFLVIAPFFTSFLIRTISWKILLGDEGPIFGFLKHGLGILPGTFSILGTPVAQVFGITYNFLPFMILPLYVALEKIDPRLLEAGADLFGNPAAVFRRVTIPLALPGIFAGTLLTFIPAMGDYINAELLGNPTTRMIGNVIQNRLLVQNDYPVGSALSFILMAGILIAVAVYAKLLGTEQLTG
ncbi:MAG TPA: ABC transporter permease [Candidatus Limnocylindrales bacterium]|jgi:spermidine/putrescine transport system permease protein|nr:ABC transporter permease [Candidatus Limnocylindrales bacterium]